MSIPTTFVDAISRLRATYSLNKEIAETLGNLLKTPGGTYSERQLITTTAEGFERTSTDLKEISVGIAQLAIVNSKEDFDKIIAAVAN